MSRIPGTTASDSIELVRRHGDMAVVDPDASAPRPSDTAMAAAEALLAEPMRMKAELLAMSEKLTEGMRQLDLTLTMLTEAVLAKKRESDPSARNFFLNEHHTTHISKSQLRKERAALKKAKAQGKAPRTSRVARKPRTSSSRSR